MSEMVFDSAAKKMLTECMEMATTRGSEYQDTWNLENQISIFTNETLNRIYKNDYTEADAPAASRLLRLAALVDTKISRIASGGRHKRDNYVDLINYLAVLGELREEYEKRQTGPKNPMEPAILGKDDPKRMKLVEEDLRFISEPNPD